MRTVFSVTFLLFSLLLAACSTPEGPQDPDPPADTVATDPNAHIETEIVKTYWDPEEKLVKEEFSVIKGKKHIKHGPYKFYTKEQNLSMEHNYVNGSMEGEIREYYENGQLWITYNFIDGAPNGSFTWYHDNGELQLKGTYDNGVYTDTLWEYDPKGELLSMQTEFETLDMENDSDF